MSQARAKKIKVILFDVDGVLTDGTIWLVPAPGSVLGSNRPGNMAGGSESGASIATDRRQPGASAASAPAVTDRRPTDAPQIGGYGVTSANIVEAKGFHAHDGTGISLARLGGIRIGLITKRISETVTLRARDLRLDFVHQGIADKAGTFLAICKEAGVKPEEVCFVGDDVIDLPVMRLCGLAIAVPNARDDVKREAHYITERKGGEGAGRDAIEYILRAQGSLERCVSEYIQERAPADSQ